MGFIRQASLPFAALMAIIAVAIVGWLGICMWGELTNNAIPEQNNIWNWVKDNSTLTIGTITILLLISAGTIASSQLVLMRRSNYAQMLIQLSEQWESDSFVRRRHIIDKICLDIKIKLKREGLEDSEIEKRLMGELSKVAKSADEKSQEDFFVITSVLGFYESLAYAIRKGDIPLVDVRDTFGGSMAYYYRLFESYITETQQRPGNENAYSELKQVVNRL